MIIHTHQGWEQREWDKGFPLPDHHTASLMMLNAGDFVPNFPGDEISDIVQRIESPVNESLQDNEGSEERDRWRLTGLMFQKTTLVDTDPENTSLAGESIEVNVTNEQSDDDHYELPVVYRRWIPMDRIKTLMDISGVTGDERIDDEVLDMCQLMDIGIASEVIVTEENIQEWNDFRCNYEKEHQVKGDENEDE